MKFKTAFLATLLCVTGWLPASAENEVKIGFLADLHGPAKDFASPIRDAAHMALVQINQQGGVLGGKNVQLVARNTGCLDLDLAVKSAKSLIADDQVTAILGAVCSPATYEAARMVSIPKGVVMVSPSSTAGAITSLVDDDLLFRTTPSDTEEIFEFAKLLKIGSAIAVAYPDNAWGKEIFNILKSRKIDFSGSYGYSPFEAKKGAYSKALTKLAEEGARQIVVVSRDGDGGAAILTQAVKSELFEKYFASNAAIDSGNLEKFDGNLAFVQASVEVPPGNFRYRRAAKFHGFDPTSPFAANAYDAAFVLALAIQKARSSDSKGLSAHIRSVATAPGEVILPGQWQKALLLLAQGKEINYEGASGLLEFDEAGDVGIKFSAFGIVDGVLASSGEIN